MFFMANERIEQQREQLKVLLGEMIGKYKEICAIMEPEKHSRGIAHRSLEAKSGDYIVHGTERNIGLSGSFTDKDGQNYDIGIFER